MIKTVQISDEIFWGYRINFTIEYFKSFQELSDYVLKQLITFLKGNNLINLMEKAAKLKLHNHNYKSYEDMCNDDKNQVIYLCGGCGFNG